MFAFEHLKHLGFSELPLEIKDDLNADYRTFLTHTGESPQDYPFTDYFEYDCGIHYVDPDGVYWFENQDEIVYGRWDPDKNAWIISDDLLPHRRVCLP
jgi:hypothetical protein